MRIKVLRIGHRRQQEFFSGSYIFCSSLMKIPLVIIFSRMKTYIFNWLRDVCFWSLSWVSKDSQEMFKMVSLVPLSWKRSFFVKRERTFVIYIALENQSTAFSLAAQIASWLKIWDFAALDYGSSGTDAMQNFFRILTKPVFGPIPCPKCSMENFDSYFHHFIIEHSPFEDVND